MNISNVLKTVDEEDEIKIDWIMIKKFFNVLSVLILIFTIFFFTCLGCFLVLNDSTSLSAQTVTLSSEGAINETYPDSLGEYQLAEEDIKGSNSFYNWYRHKYRFLMYNKLGNIVC